MGISQFVIRTLGREKEGISSLGFAREVARELARDMLFRRQWWKQYDRGLYRGSGEIVSRLDQEWPVEALFTTTTGLFLLKNGCITCLLSGRFTGLTRYLGTYYLAEELFHTKRGRILSFELTNDQVGPIKTLFIEKNRGGLHQLDFIGDRLFFLDTHVNNVGIIVPGEQEAIRVYPNGIHTENRPWQDVDYRYYCHYNSIFGIGGKVYVLAHNETIKSGRRSQVHCFDQDDYTRSGVLESVPAGGNSHNILINGERFLVCDSLSGDLIDNGEPVVQTGNFTRGLAMNDDHVLLGVSEMASRYKRTDSNSAIWLLDDEYEKLSIVDLEKLGQVYDIRLVDRDYGISNEANDGGG
jgi:hypothetical protein